MNRRLFLQYWVGLTLLLTGCGRGFREVSNLDSKRDPSSGHGAESSNEDSELLVLTFLVPPSN